MVRQPYRTAIEPSRYFRELYGCHIGTADSLIPAAVVIRQPYRTVIEPLRYFRGLYGCHIGAADFLNIILAAVVIRQYSSPIFKEFKLTSQNKSIWQIAHLLPDFPHNSFRTLSVIAIFLCFVIYHPKHLVHSSHQGTKHFPFHILLLSTSPFPS